MSTLFVVERSRPGCKREMLSTRADDEGVNLAPVGAPRDGYLVDFVQHRVWLYTAFKRMFFF